MTVTIEMAQAGHRAFLESTNAHTPQQIFVEIYEAMRALDPARTLRADAVLALENDRLRKENARLSRAVCSGVLNDLLTPDENTALLAFVKTLRNAAAGAPEAGRWEAVDNVAAGRCEDCPPTGYSTDKTRCDQCPRKLGRRA